MKLFDLELSSPCNAKCDFCPQKFLGVKRERPFMDEEVLDKVTTEIGRFALSERVMASFGGMGENLLRKPLLIRALDNLEKESRGKIETMLVTNGSHLTEDLLEHESFLKLKEIRVSVTGHDKETYEEIFRLKYDKVVANIVTFAEKLPGKICIHAVDLVRLRGHRGEFERRWNDLGIRVQYASLHSRGGHLDDPEAYPGRTRQFDGCEIFDFVHFISSDGLVLSCCHDVRSDNVVGDCRVSTLSEIVERKRELRKRRFEGYAICSKCTDFVFEGADRRALET